MRRGQSVWYYLFTTIVTLATLYFQSRPEVWVWGHGG